MPNSWLHLRGQDPDHRLPAELADGDAFAARDCGWVEQMRPFIREFSRPGETVLDPFCGFASTLVAASLEGRNAVGVEVEPRRCSIARERLSALGLAGAELIEGNCVQALSRLKPADLVISSVPYFGCGMESRQLGQLYDSACYVDYLMALRAVLKAVKTALKPDGYLVLASENVRLGGHFVPQAWDLARLMAERFRFIEERIIVYDKPSDDRSPLSNRAHEYMLIARNQDQGVDLDLSLEYVLAIQRRFPQALAIGGFVRWLDRQPVGPSDVDLYLPYDIPMLGELAAWLDQHRFRITRWGEPLAPDCVVVAAARARYFRAERLDNSGRRVLIDIGFSEPGDVYARLCERAVFLQGVRCVTGAVDLA